MASVFSSRVAWNEAGRWWVVGTPIWCLAWLVGGHEMRESGRGQRWEDRGKRRNGSMDGL